MPNRPLNAPHVALAILHQMYHRILWLTADLMATPQQKFPTGSPSHVKVQRVPGERAPLVLSLCEEDMGGKFSTWFRLRGHPPLFQHCI